MSDKYTAIKAAMGELDRLMDQLKSNELAFDKALTRSTQYLGNDQDIEDARDQKVRDELDSIAETKGAIKSKLSEIDKLIDEEYPK